MLDDLIWILESAFERSGVFFVGELETGQPEKMALLLGQRLKKEGISAVTCRLDRAAAHPFQPFDRLFRQAQMRGERTVLLVWCLEHLSEPQLKKTLRWFNSSREHLCQQGTAGQVSIPIVLLAQRTTYHQYVVPWAGDLVDCLPTPFELTL